jgi:myo-inositol-1(or 4)-monophosphatase
MDDFLIEQRVAEAVAREAGQRILRGRGAGFDVGLKGKNDLVIDVDTAVEQFVKQALIEAFPGDSVLGEERGTDGDDEARRWFVDPIDGTMNFVQGIPVFCVSIALRVDDEFVVGVIYDPNRDELFSGRRGNRMKVNGADTAVAPTDALADAVLATGFPPLKSAEAEDNLAIFARVTRASRGVRRLGSAALDLAYVAAGRLDGFWEFHLNPWDTAAGTLLVELAGGRVTDIAGSPHSGFEGNIVATNGRIHDALRKQLGVS